MKWKNKQKWKKYEITENLIFHMNHNVPMVCTVKHITESGI